MPTDLDQMSPDEFYDWLQFDSEEAAEHRAVMQMLRYTHGSEADWAQACRVVYTGIPDPRVSAHKLAVVSRWLRLIPTGGKNQRVNQ